MRRNAVQPSGIVSKCQSGFCIATGGGVARRHLVTFTTTAALVDGICYDLTQITHTNVGSRKYK